MLSTVELLLGGLLASPLSTRPAAAPQVLTTVYDAGHFDAGPEGCCG